VVYWESKLSDLKNVSHWRFSSEVVNKFFAIPYLQGEYIDRYYTENVGTWNEINELNINPIEGEYLWNNDSTVTRDLQNKPAKGLEAVIARYSIEHTSIISQEQLSETFQMSDLSERSKTGIFFKSTVEKLVEEIIAKSEIVRAFKICIVGVHCVVSVSRLILEFENASLTTEFSFLIIEYSAKKIADLKAIFQDSELTMKTKIIYHHENFLFVPNHSLQKQNIVLCFLNQSSTRIFALKFILLQCYCNSKNSRGLQTILCSQRVSILIIYQ
jgi:hypothetical protein